MVQPNKATDVAKDIARIALRGHIHDTAILREVFDYCWEQLQWCGTTNELVELRNSLRLDGEGDDVAEA